MDRDRSIPMGVNWKSIATLFIWANDPTFASFTEIVDMLTVDEMVYLMTFHSNTPIGRLAWVGIAMKLGIQQFEVVTSMESEKLDILVKSYAEPVNPAPQVKMEVN